MLLSVAMCIYVARKKHTINIDGETVDDLKFIRNARIFQGAVLALSELTVLGLAAHIHYIDSSAKAALAAIILIEFGVGSSSGAVCNRLQWLVS